MSARCNELTHRFTARAAWFASPGHTVGLYIATEEAGIIFIQVPVKVWHACMRAETDANGNPIPQAAADSLAQCTADAERIRREQEEPKPARSPRRGPMPDAAQVASTVADFLASGLTAYGYAKKTGTPYCTLVRWIKLVREGGLVVS